MSKEPCIQLHNVSYRYADDLWVLRHIDLSIAPGEWVTILGGNGSGKSTLALVLSLLRLAMD